MLSVIIPTHNSERTLVATLAALVPGATAGLIAEVILADAGSQDDTATIADVAGANLMMLEGPLARRLRMAAAEARAPWLLFLRPGIVLDTPWTVEVGRYIQQEARHRQAAVFRRGGSQSGWRAFWSLLAGALGGLPRPEQGLLIAKPFYDALGGHSERAGDPEAELVRRIGRSQTVTLSTGAFSQILD